jgi:hypothetical protein
VLLRPSDALASFVVLWLAIVSGHEAMEMTLRKPVRPRAPAKPDLRKVTDPQKVAAKWQAYNEQHERYLKALKEYEEVLYPEYVKTYEAERNESRKQQRVEIEDAVSAADAARLEQTASQLVVSVAQALTDRAVAAQLEAAAASTALERSDELLIQQILYDAYFLYKLECQAAEVDRWNREADGRASRLCGLACVELQLRVDRGRVCVALQPRRSSPAAILLTGPPLSVEFRQSSMSGARSSTWLQYDLRSCYGVYFLQDWINDRPAFRRSSNIWAYVPYGSSSFNGAGWTFEEPDWVQRAYRWSRKPPSLFHCMHQAMWVIDLDGRDQRFGSSQFGISSDPVLRSPDLRNWSVRGLGERRVDPFGGYVRPLGWHPAPSIEVRVVAPDASAVDIASSHFSHRLSEIVSQQTASRSARESGRWHAGPARTLQWRGRTLCGWAWYLQMP